MTQDSYKSLIDRAEEVYVNRHAEQAVTQLVDFADTLASATDMTITGLMFMQCVGLKMLRNCLSNTIGADMEDPTEEKLEEFYTEWLSDVTDALKLTGDKTLMEMREDIRNQVEADNAQAG